MWRGNYGVDESFICVAEYNDDVASASSDDLSESVRRSDNVASDVVNWLLLSQRWIAHHRRLPHHSLQISQRASGH